MLKPCKLLLLAAVDSGSRGTINVAETSISQDAFSDKGFLQVSIEAFFTKSRELDFFETQFQHAEFD